MTNDKPALTKVEVWAELCNSFIILTFVQFSATKKLIITITSSQSVVSLVTGK